MSKGAIIFGNIGAFFIVGAMLWALNSIKYDIPVWMFVALCAILVGIFLLIGFRLDKRDADRKANEQFGRASKK